jgi:hypothetical protein
VALTLEQLKKRIHTVLPKYTLIDYDINKSITTATQLHLKCPKGHDWKTARLGNIERGCKCRFCESEKRGKSYRICTEEFKLRLQDMGYELLSEFKGYMYRVEIRCLKCSDIRTCLPYNIRGTCKNCVNIERRNKAFKESSNCLQKRLQNTGYSLLNQLDYDVDKVGDLRLHLRCNRDHEYWTSYASFIKHESHCGICLHLARLDLTQIRQRLDPGWAVEGVYVNETSPLTFFCPHGTSYVSNWNKYQRGYRCGCNTKHHGPTPLSIIEIHKRLFSKSLKWIGLEEEYVNVHSELSLQCTKNENHIPFKKPFAHMYANSIYCPDCQDEGDSIAERELKGYFQSMGIQVEQGHRKFGFEIDLFLPEYKIGIEHNGLFHHNESTKDMMYHEIKWRKSKENNVNLISIYEDEYASNPSKIREYLKYILFKSNCVQISLQDCEYKEVIKEDAIKFYAQFCILGIPERQVVRLRHFGLYYFSKLIFLASFSLDGDITDALYLDRYACDFEYHIEGGIDYIIDKVVDTYPKIKQINFNLDRRFPLYSAPTGFIFFEEIKPKLTFVRGRERRTPYQLRIKNEDSLDTVVEQRKNQGWARIYDCGHETWIKHIDTEKKIEDHPKIESKTCWQYLLREKYFKEDLILHNLTENQISKISINDIVFNYAGDSDKDEIKQFILRYEWLGRMPMRPTHRFTARYRGILVGVIIFSVPNAFSYILGEENKNLEKLISRGASISWAPKNLGSALLMFAIRWLVDNTRFRVFTAYSDPEANEIGTIYQACNFYYMGSDFGTKILYFDPQNPKAGWFSGRIFRKINRIKQYAKKAGIAWEEGWNQRWTVLWKNIPNENKMKIVGAMEDHKNRCIKKEAEMKHKYCYVWGKTQRETKELRKIFFEKNKIYDYPKRTP